MVAISREHRHAISADALGDIEPEDKIAALDISDAETPSEHSQG
jgi:hypothetical protein